VTVGGEGDKVKPNGKNWLNSSSNRACLTDRYVPSPETRQPPM
jgi:hypothetical protein